MSIRPATIADTEEILALIYELAVYEKAPDDAKAMPLLRPVSHRISHPLQQHASNFLQALHTLVF